ncbi:hypothetical protein OPQ81_004403 [Rhizoctonia solani]|nr:hypothetical protein OPQ81_004403 [Rhizoctonia solani]
MQSLLARARTFVTSTVLRTASKSTDNASANMLTTTATANASPNLKPVHPKVLNTPMAADVRTVDQSTQSWAAKTSAAHAVSAKSASAPPSWTISADGHACEPEEHAKNRQFISIGRATKGDSYAGSVRMAS